MNKTVLNYTMEEIIYFIAMLLFCRYHVHAISGLQGQNVILNFPYPCNSTEITLQHSIRPPFYRSSDRPPLSLAANQAERFEVHNSVGKEICFLDLTIRNLIRYDQGTYILFIYKDGEGLGDLYRIMLYVDYPPGMASCAVGQNKGRGWVLVHCTAVAGSVRGKIECYQDGNKMLSWTNSTETESLLTQTILIRKSQPAFCCSSAIIEYKDMCTCDDTALYVQNTSDNVPCSPVSTQPPANSVHVIKDFVNKTQSLNTTTVSRSTYIPTENNIKKESDINKSVIIFVVVAIFLVIGITVHVIVLYKLNKNNNTTNSRPTRSKDPKTSNKFDRGSLKKINTSLSMTTEGMNSIPHQISPFMGNTCTFHPSAF